MKPKAFILNLIGIFCIFVALLVGTLPFACAFLCGLLVISRNLSHSLSFCFAATITMFSAAYPDAFDFGFIRLRPHDVIRIHDEASLLPSLIWNIIMASIGTKAGAAMRIGYRDAKPTA